MASAGGNRCGATVDKKFVRPKRVRRGRKHKKDSRGDQSRLCKFLYANVRGFRSKSESINQIIEEHDVDVILLTETKVYTNSAIDIKGFQSFSAVKDKKSGGGLYLGIRHGLYESVMINSGSKASFVTVCLNGKDCSVRFILVYGPQKNDSKDKNSFYNGISVQVERAYLNGCSVIMVGDFNAKLGYDVIRKYLHPMSKNGEQLFELCNKYNLKLMNASEHCEGVFTRIDKYKQTIEKSVVGYVFISSDLEEYFTSMQIDEKKHFTPWRSLKHDKRYSDHCAVKFCMNMKAFEQKQASDKIWNFNDPEGWEKFNKLTEPSTIVSDMWQVGHHTEISYQKWQKNLNGILHLCFKKKRIWFTKGIIIRRLDSSLKRESSWKDSSQIPSLSIRN